LPEVAQLGVLVVMVLQQYRPIQHVLPVLPLGKQLAVEVGSLPLVPHLHLLRTQVVVVV
jgi:hypothetical protein